MNDLKKRFKASSFVASTIISKMYKKRLRELRESAKEKERDNRICAAVSFWNR